MSRSVRINDAALKALLGSTKRIAVLGYSGSPDKPSNHVANYLVEEGKYTVFGVNPTLPLGVDPRTGVVVVKDILSLPEEVDIVDVFRRPDALPDVLAEVKSLPYKPRCVWFQEGVTHAAVEAAMAEHLAEVKGTLVVDRCILKEHERLMLQGAHL